MSEMEKRLNEALKGAMRDKNQPVLDCIRQVKGAMGTHRTDPSFKGEVTDETWIEVIGGYVKQIGKSLEEYRGDDERVAAMRRKLEFEIAYLTPYLPAQPSEAEIREAVQAAIAELNLVEAKQAGRAVGAVMKKYKGRVDGAVVKRIAEGILGAR